MKEHPVQANKQKLDLMRKDERDQVLLGQPAKDNNCAALPKKAFQRQLVLQELLLKQECFCA
jgi:hypothetical protein